jgi:hypothetical protein
MKSRKESIRESINRYSVVVEAIVGIIAVAYLIYVIRSMLIFGKTTLAHDNILWNYPIFQFFAENIINGHFPLWNPFEHGGEPFYPILGQIRLFEPVALLIIFLGQFITNDIVMLFNWNRFIQSLVMAFGVYIVFRPLAANLFIRLSLVPILLYSSVMFGSFQQDAILNQFLWIPFVTYFLLRIIYYKDYHWRNWLMLACVIGINWQSYFFVGTWVFLLFFSVGIMLFRKDLITELFNAKLIIPKLAVLAFVIFAMATPNVALILEMDKYIFPARIIDFTSYEGEIPQGGPIQYEAGHSFDTVHSIIMPYKNIVFTGTFSTIWDFIQIISPDGNKHIRWPGRNLWGEPSEAYIYLGFLPWAIALLGLVAGRNDFKRVWLLILIAFGLLMLGPPGGLQRLLYYIYPPMWFVRHTHTFVLFFIFALLYFYVLGFNHIFRTWQGAVFSHHNAQGLLSRFIKNGKVCRLAALFMISACIVASVYLMTQLIYPATNYMFVFIILILAVGWFMRKDLGEKGLYASLIISHIVIILIFSPNTFKFIRSIILSIGLPLVLFLFMKSRKDFSASFSRYAPFILLSVFSISLIGDLVYSLKKSSSLYNATRHPMSAMGIDTTPHKPAFSIERISHYIHRNTNVYDQSMRYLSLVSRKPSAFFTLQDPGYSDLHPFPKTIYKRLKNLSFETWVVSKDGGLLPEGFKYEQDGKGGSVERYNRKDGVKDGLVSILLKPSSRGNSLLRFTSDSIEELRDKYVRMSIWVKSEAKIPASVQVDIQDGVGPVIMRSYQNYGDWERLELLKYVDEEAKNLYVTLNVKSSPAYFDDIKIEVVELKRSTVDFALMSKRWSSFLLTRKYFDLINSNISPIVLKKMFTIGEAPLQFKLKAVEVDDNKTPTFLSRLGADDSVKLLKEAVIVNSVSRASTAGLKILPSEFVIGNKTAFNGAENESMFRYNIASYGYDYLNIVTNSASDGVLYWADGYDKNWHAYVNGNEVPVFRANINFKAISLPKGVNQVKFVFKPFLFNIGLFVFYGLFTVVCISSVVVSWSYTKKRPIAALKNVLTEIWEQEWIKTIACYILAALIIFSITKWTFNKINTPPSGPPAIAQRWGLMGFSDFLTLMAGKRFHEEGFLNHYLTSNMTVGYKEFSRGWVYYQVPQVVPNSAIYYTHYGSLDGIINGIVRATRLGNDLLKAYKVTAILSALSLVFWFGASKILFGRFIALASTFFIGTSLLFLWLMDTIAAYSYDFFFAFGAVFFFVISEKFFKKGSITARATRAVSWAFIFLQASNSPEFVLWIQITLLGFLWIENGSLLRQWKAVLFLFSAPLSAYVLHFLKMAWVLGGVSNLAMDLLSALKRRTVNFKLAEETPFAGFNIFDTPMYINQLLEHYCGIGIWRAAILFIVLYAVTYRLRFYSDEAENAKILKRWRFLMVFLFAGIAFWIPFVQATVTGVAVRTFFPFAGALFGISLLQSFRYLSVKKESLMLRILLVSLVFIGLWHPVWQRVGGQITDLSLHFKPPEHFGRHPNEVVLLTDFWKQETAYGDIILTDINAGNHGFPRYPFPAYEYLSDRRIEKIKDSAQLKQRLDEFRKIQRDLPDNNPAKWIRLYLFLDDKKNDKGLLELASGKPHQILNTKKWSLRQYGAVPTFIEESNFFLYNLEFVLPLDIPVTKNRVAMGLFDGAKALWHMDEEKGAVVADEKKINNGVAYNTQIVQGAFGKARYFNGESSYLMTPLHFKDSPGITISLWIKPEKNLSSKDDLCIVFDTGHDKDKNFVLQSTDKNEKRFAWYSGGNVVLFDLPHKKWTHLALIIDARKHNMEVYSDGVRIGMTSTASSGFKIDSSSLTFGRFTKSNARYYKGAIDEVAVWDRALSELEIARLLKFYSKNKQTIGNAKKGELL